MKRNIKKYIILGLSVALGLPTIQSCKKALDINTNPNSPTYSTPELVLPQAMVATAQQVPGFNTYGGRFVGYYATSGGVSGWGDILTYDYATSAFGGLWSGIYNTLTDLDYVVKNTNENSNYKDLNQAAVVLMAYNFANLVDTYNDIPYSEALQGAAFLTPKYDKASDIYVDLAKKLDAAVAYFKANQASDVFKKSDIIFKGNNTSWAKFANTLKLRLVLRAGSKATFANKTIDPIGVITDDVIVQPGFTKIAGKQNPMWNTWAYGADGAAVGTWGTQFIPTPFIMAFFDGSKLSDEARASLFFANGISTNVNQLGNTTNPPVGVAPSAWVMRPASGSISATNYRGYGAIKGPSAGQPLMLGAEGNFLGAEAVVEGLLSGDAKTYFENGIKASYIYLNKNESDVVANGANANTYLENYVAANEGKYLADWSAASTKDQKLEAIITQKYIAMNFLFGHESYNEYRRIGYPKITGSNVAGNAKNNFISTESRSTAPDKNLARLPYPASEFSYNSGNIPVVDKYTSKLFWAK
ncbi:MAG: hypothetical protein K0R59_717 [Sphingobacterium sp.]|jgi:hypothetical protein|nr:hypothetical protein [Sphingobacterium sp.]